MGSALSNENAEIEQELLKVISDSEKTPKERRAMLTKLIRHQDAIKSEEAESVAKAV